MLLAIDVGNSHTVVGLYNKDKLEHHWRLETRPARTVDEYGALLLQFLSLGGAQKTAVDAVAVSNVVPAVRHALSSMCERYFGLKPLFVEPGIRTGMPILYDDPREVGADRIVNSVAAFERYRSSLIVVDFGTATTFDAVNGKGEYVGGAIAPGIGISMEALFSSTAKLPRVEFSPPPSVIGTNTIHSIQSGLVFGYASLVDGLCQKIAGKLPGTPKVVATGGFASLIAKVSSAIVVVDEFLTLEGLRILHERNSPMSESNPGNENPGGENPASSNAGCPITADFLPETMKKHVAPESPVPLRMMAAKGLVPLAASDLAQVFFMLTYDADPTVAEAALKSAQELPDRIASSAFRDEELEPPTLGWYLGLLGLQNPGYAEMLILNSSTPDTAVAALAAQCGRATANIIGSNQLRILRDTEIIRQLAKNPEAQGALIDGVCDFAVRSGVKLQDVSEMAAAAVRLYGANADAELDKDKETADALLEEMEAPERAAVVHNLYKRVQSLSVVQRMRLAAKGNKECRDLLLRDSNRLVAVSAMRNPAMTEGEVLTQAANRLAFSEVIRVILNNRDWMRKYPVRLALAKNPKVPQGHALRILNSLREGDLRSLGRDRNVPGAIQAVARKISAAKKY